MGARLAKQVLPSGTVKILRITAAPWAKPATEHPAILPFRLAVVGAIVGFIMNENQLARGLAVFSLGLGFAELFAPRQVARLAGVNERHARTIQAFGLREIGSGLGIMQGKAAYFLWSRVAGDVMDLGMLGAEYRSNHGNRRRLAGAMGAVAAVTVLDVIASILHNRDYAEPSWRDSRTWQSRGAIERGDPQASRAALDETMARHQSGHVYRDAEAATNPPVQGQLHAADTSV
jgi:hypothetical protein